MPLDAGWGDDDEAGVGDAGAVVGLGFGASGQGSLDEEDPLTCAGVGPAEPMARLWL